MAQFTTYEAEAITVVVANIPITEGKPQGTFLSVAPDEAEFGATQALDGHVARWRRRNSLWTVELTLLQTSSHHQQLSALHAADVGSFGGAGIGSFLVYDTRGATKLVGKQCWIEQSPEAEWGPEVAEWTWTFKVVSGAAAMIFGGN
jgi:hypothetical protein